MTKLYKSSIKPSDLLWKKGDHACTFGDYRFVFHNKDLYENSDIYTIIQVFHPMYSNICQIIISKNQDDKIYRLMIYSRDDEFAKKMNKFFIRNTICHPEYFTTNEFNYSVPRLEIELFVSRLYYNFLNHHGDLTSL